MSRGRLAVSSGMTLMETLVVVAIVGVLSLMLLEAVRIVGLTYNSHVQRDDVAIENASAAAVIRNALRFAHPLVRQKEDGSEEALFEGDPKRVRLIVDSKVISRAAPAIAIDRSGLVWLVAVWDREQQAVVFSVSPFRELAPPQSEIQMSGEQTSVLLQDVERLSFQYFGAFEQGEEPSWRDQWRSAETLPRLVRVSILQRGGEARSITVAPQAAPISF